MKDFLNLARGSKWIGGVREGKKRQKSESSGNLKNPHRVKDQCSDSHWFTAAACDLVATVNIFSINIIYK